jgi:peptidoglycan/LPS O-acetylase OafA/YrhL
VVVSQRLYPIPIRWRAVSIAAITFAACAVTGYIADRTLDLGATAVLAKLALGALLAAGCVVGGLTPRRDLARAFEMIGGKLRGAGA